MWVKHSCDKTNAGLSRLLQHPHSIHLESRALLCPLFLGLLLFFLFAYRFPACSSTRFKAALAFFSPFYELLYLSQNCENFIRAHLSLITPLDSRTERCCITCFFHPANLDFKHDVTLRCCIKEDQKGV